MGYPTEDLIKVSNDNNRNN